MSSQASPFCRLSTTSSMLREIWRMRGPEVEHHVVRQVGGAVARRSPTNARPGPRRCSSRCFAASSRSSAAFVAAGSPRTDFSASSPARTIVAIERASLADRSAAPAFAGATTLSPSSFTSTGNWLRSLSVLVLAGQRLRAHDARHGDRSACADPGGRGGRGRARRCAATAGTGRSWSARTAPSGTARWPAGGSRPRGRSARRTRPTRRPGRRRRAGTPSVAAAWPAPRPPMPGVSTTTRPCFSSGLGTVISTPLDLLLVARVARLADPVGEARSIGTARSLTGAPSSPRRRTEAPARRRSARA